MDEMAFGNKEESKSGQDKGDFDKPAHTIATMRVVESSDIPERMSAS